MRITSPLSLSLSLSLSYTHAHAHMWYLVTHIHTHVDVYTNMVTNVYTIIVQQSYGSHMVGGYYRSDSIVTVKHHLPLTSQADQIDPTFSPVNIRTTPPLPAYSVESLLDHLSSTHIMKPYTEATADSDPCASVCSSTIESDGAPSSVQDGITIAEATSTEPLSDSSLSDCTCPQTPGTSDILPSATSAHATDSGIAMPTAQHEETASESLIPHWSDRAIENSLTQIAISFSLLAVTDEPGYINESQDLRGKNPCGAKHEVGDSEWQDPVTKDGSLSELCRARDTSSEGVLQEDSGCVTCGTADTFPQIEFH